MELQTHTHFTEHLSYSKVLDFWTSLQCLPCFDMQELSTEIRELSATAGAENQNKGSYIYCTFMHLTEAFIKATYIASKVHIYIL